jgi:hypothetical protein
MVICPKCLEQTLWPWEHIKEEVHLMIDRKKGEREIGRDQGKICSSRDPPPPAVAYLLHHG